MVQTKVSTLGLQPTTCWARSVALLVQLKLAATELEVILVVTSGKVLRHTTSLALLEGRLEDNLSGTATQIKDSAREAMNTVVVEAMLAQSPKDLSWVDQPIPNPCIGPGMQKVVDLKFPADHPLGPKVRVTMVGPKGCTRPLGRKSSRERAGGHR
jgi:hypothetical protein